MANDLDIIKQLEKQIGKSLPQLEWIRFGHYNYTPIGYVLNGRGNVIGLCLREKEISDITKLRGLTNLQSLKLYIDELTDVTALQGLTNLKELQLYSNNKLTDVTALQGLINLQHLDLHSNQLTDVTALQGLINLQHLGLQSNQLTDVTALQGLTKLKELQLYSNNKLTDVTALRGLINLQHLDLQSNQLTDVTALRGLTNLQYLDLSSNRLTDVTALRGLTSLQQLELRSNHQLTDVTALRGLTNLQHLDLSSNWLTDVTALRGLTSLQHLELGFNQLTDVTALQGLTNLQHLGLNSNRLTDVTALQGLINLQHLGLGFNQLTDVTALQGLTNLQYLDLSSNRLTDVTALRGLTSLQQMEIVLKDIFEFGLDGSRFREINLFNNPLEEPPIEIIKQGKEAIRAYFAENNKQPLHELKVLFVGDGGAGKTSLIKCVRGKPIEFYESQTQGIAIDDSKLKHAQTAITLHFWDFGGQEIMHATHQFFFSQRSIYVLVVDSRKEGKPDYWLKHLASFGGNAPILVVINKIDEHPHFDLDRAVLQRQYPQIQGFYRVSCKNDAGLREFRNSLRDVIIAYFEHQRITWPQNWFKVKARLESMEEPFINHDRYQMICEAEGVRPAARATLADFLHDLGVILHFKQFGLDDTYVLNPRWLTAAVYRIITSPFAAQHQGIVNLNDLEAILQSRTVGDYCYPLAQHHFIIEVMQKFEICFQLDDQRILLPDLLPIPEPQFSFDYASALKFHLNYDFLPKSVMTRFLVKLHQDINGELRWRTGVVLAHPKLYTTAVVKADPDRRTINVWVNGALRRDYLAILRDALNRINQSFQKLTVNEMMPCICNTCLNSPMPHFYSHDKLTERLKKGKSEIACPQSDEDVSIDAILQGLKVTPITTEAEMLQILRDLKEKNDTEETLREKAWNIIEFKPSFLGFSVDIGKLIRMVFGKK